MEAKSMPMSAKPVVIVLLLGVAGCGEAISTSAPAVDSTAPPVTETSPSEATAMPEQDRDTDTDRDRDKNENEKVVRAEQQWRQLLTAEQYHVLREKGTERPFTNKFDKHFERGTYACAGCGQQLFHSETKFDSGCGWPAFYAAQAGDRVNLSADHSLGMIRTEVTCARCDSHLGHVFDDAPQTPTGQRYCINSVALKFIPDKEHEGVDKPDADQQEVVGDG
jgi:peptide-methionine (R)-S-oxide reductase